jgi:hypothetical protein
MVRGRDPDPDVQLHQTARGWAEPRPPHCPDCGAALGPRKVLVGVAQCRCGRSHRTHFCRERAELHLLQHNCAFEGEYSAR